MEATPVQTGHQGAGGGARKVNVPGMLARVPDHWHPSVIAALNGQHVLVVKMKGAFTWHRHAEADELFLVVRGGFRMEFRDRTVEVGAGELIVVPRGVQHRPVADEEAEVVLIEPAGTVNTGEVREARTVEAPEWL